MEIIRGKQTSTLDASTLAARLAGYTHLHIDIGTGDGRYALHMAQVQPQTFVIGLDACRENLVAASRQGPVNALFVIANAEAVPAALHGLATSLTVNFPWGSLIRGLLDPDSAVIAGLVALSAPGASLELRLNAGALAEAGVRFEDGAQQVRTALALSGFAMRGHVMLANSDLKACPTTWARRLAFGRDPSAVLLQGQRREERRVEVA